VPTTSDYCDKLEPHIGDTLRDARLEIGQSLADVAGSLHIQETYLSAIERLDKLALPSIGYVLGFVRSYSLHLGLDAVDAVARYKIDIECPHNMGISDRPHFVPKRKIRIPKGSFAAGTVLSCFLVLVSWYGWKTDARSAQAVSEPVSVVQNWGFEAVEPTQGDPDIISLKAIGPSWVQVKDVSGTVLISRIMVPGELFETRIENAPLLSLRDAGAIELYIGGQRIGPIGQKGANAKNIPLATAADTSTASASSEQ